MHGCIVAALLALRFRGVCASRCVPPATGGCSNSRFSLSGETHVGEDKRVNLGQAAVGYHENTRKCPKTVGRDPINFLICWILRKI